MSEYLDESEVFGEGGSNDHSSPGGRDGYLTDTDVFGKPERSFVGNVSKLAIGGAKRLAAGAPLADDVAFGTFDNGAAARIATGLNMPDDRPPELQQVTEAFEPYTKEWEDAEGFGESARVLAGMAGTIGKQAVTNPKGLAYATAEQAANMVPAMGGMLAGGQLGTVAGAGFGPVGAIVGGIAGALGGAFVGGWSVEAGLEVTGYVGEELAKRGLEPTEQNVQSLLQDKEVSDNVIGMARRKATGTAGVDAALTLAGGRVATAPVRAAQKAAIARLGKGASREAIEAATKENLKQMSKLSRAGYGAAGGAIDIVGEGLSEAAGQQWATGELNMADIAQETFAGVGGAAPSVITAGKAMATRPGEAATNQPPAAPPTIPPNSPLTRAASLLAGNTTYPILATGYATTPAERVVDRRADPEGWKRQEEVAKKRNEGAINRGDVVQRRAKGGSVFTRDIPQAEPILTRQGKKKADRAEREAERQRERAEFEAEYQRYNDPGLTEQEERQSFPATAGMETEDRRREGEWTKQSKAAENYNRGRNVRGEVDRTAREYDEQLGADFERALIDGGATLPLSKAEEQAGRFGFPGTTRPMTAKQPEAKPNPRQREMDEFELAYNPDARASLMGTAMATDDKGRSEWLRQEKKALTQNKVRNFQDAQTRAQAINEQKRREQADAEEARKRATDPLYDAKQRFQESYDAQGTIPQVDYPSDQAAREFEQKVRGQQKDRQHREWVRAYKRKQAEDKAISEDETIPPEVRKQAAKEADDIVNADPVYGHMAEAKRRGKLNLEAFGQDYDKDTIRQIIRRYPGIFSQVGTVQPDDFASEMGYASLDDMVRRFSEARTKAELTAQIIRERTGEWQQAEDAKQADDEFFAAKAERGDGGARWKGDPGGYQGRPLRTKFPATDEEIAYMEDLIRRRPDNFTDDDLDHWTYTAEQQGRLRQALREAQQDDSSGSEMSDNTEQGQGHGDTVASDATPPADAAAADAAHSPDNDLPDPTDAQKEAGNYKKAHVRLYGLDISIENPAGSTRSGVDPDGKRWEVPIRDHYGYIKGTVGKDKDHLDVFIPEGFIPTDKDKVFVVNQIDPKTGKFDEHKIVFGSQDEAAARTTYLRNYDKTGPERVGSITEMPLDEFKGWLDSGDTTKPASPVRGSDSAKDETQPSSQGEDETQSDLPGAGTGTAPSSGEASNAEGQQDADMADVPETDFGKTNAERPQGVEAELAATSDEDLDAMMDDVFGEEKPAAKQPKAPAKPRMTPLEKFLGDLEGKGAARDARGRGFKIVSSPADDGSFVLEVVDESGDRRTIGRPYPPGRGFSRAEAIGRAVEEASFEKPARQAQPKPPKTAGQITKQGGIAALEGVRSAMAGLNALFGGNNRLGSGLAFDEDTYAQAKPHFVQAWNHAKEAGYSLKELLQYFHDQFGKAVRPYLERFLADVKAGNLDAAPTDADDRPPAKSTTGTDAWRKATIFLADYFQNMHEVVGWNFKSITDARAVVAERFANRPERLPDTTSGDFRKAVEEAIETAVVRIGGDIVSRGRSAGMSSRQVFDQLVELYEKQPKLGTRTSDSVRDQAYSTPVPIAFLANTLGGMTGRRGQLVFEPTAGTGMLTISADRDSVIANEMNPDRAAILRSLGIRSVIEGDALDVTGYPPADVVMANPPFGTVVDDNGKQKMFEIGGFKTAAIDHAISLHALEQMDESGSAVLIIGGANKLLREPEARAKQHYGKGRIRRFFKHLYGKYNVTDHFTIAGELYEKQGAGWPIDVIVIHGKGQSKKAEPSFVAPPIYSSFEDIGGRLDEIQTGKERIFGVDATRGQQEAANPERGPRTSAEGRRPSYGGQDDDAQRGGGGNAVQADNQSGSGGGTGGTVNPAGNTGRPGAAAGTGQPGTASIEPGADSAVDGQRGDDSPGVKGNRGPEESARGARGTGTAGQPDTVGVAGGAVAGGAKPGVIASEGQSHYQPVSSSEQIGTLTPQNMALPIQRALGVLAEKHGSVDAFVQGLLKYPSKKELHAALSAEQIDAVALALDNVQRGSGFVLGDQTGIGKGRVVASMIRYAYLNGKIPVFITEKQGLYADMYRDLMDIGMDKSIVDEIMQTNTDEVELHRNDDLGELVTLKSPSRWSQTLGSVEGMPTVGKGKNARQKKIVFTTYDQMSAGAKEGDADLPPRRRFLHQLVAGGNAMLIMDESHNAGGSSNLQSLRPDKRTGITPYPRALFFRHLIDQANGVVYSSATYAKNPEVMSLYSATDLRLGVGGDISALANAVTSGGIPFQQITAAMLAESGQYIRRERSFDGVSYTPKAMQVNTKAAEKVSESMSDIREFEQVWIAPVFESDPDAMGSSAVGDIGEKSQNFTSLMHNIIDQMLLGLKAKPAVEEAIRILKAGTKDNEQVVLTVSNTMGAFIDEYAKATETPVGSEFNASFGDLLIRYLYKTRLYKVRQDGDAEPEEHWLSDDEIGPDATRAYNALVKKISSTDFSAIPVSPVDYLLNELNLAGFPALEITGRDMYVDYSSGRPILAARPAKEKSVDGRTATIKAFNNGKNRAIILNRSGSTGISLHASERNPPAGRGKRTMIIVQAEKDINVHMQMLGRIHRTGQVITPAYIQAVADIPAERKVAAVLVGKMASLNANTTADKDSPLSDKSSVDFMNKYGDRVAASLLHVNPQLNALLGWPYSPDDTNNDGLMKKVTGRLPLLPIADQETTYQALTDAYNDMIAELDAMGRNDLEAKTFDLDAKTVEELEVMASTGDSPFQGRVVAEKVDMKRIGKPYSSKEIDALLEEADESPGLMQAATERFDAFEQETLERAQKRIDEAATDSARSVAIEAMERKREELQANRYRFQALSNLFRKGEPVMVNMNMGEDSEEMYGIVLSVVQRGEPTNPLALSTWRARIAVADGIRLVNLPFSRFMTGYGNDSDSVSVRPLRAPVEEVKKLFDSALRTSREERWIITGNLFTGYSTFQRSNGRIINFTRDDGSITQGILMPARFNPQEEMDKTPVAFETADQAIAYLQQVGNGAVNLRQPGELKLVHLSNGDVYRVSTQSAVSKAGRFFRDDRALLDITGRFTSLGNRMATDELTVDQIRSVFDLFARRGNTWFASDSLDVARGTVRPGAGGATAPASQGMVTGEENVTYGVSEPRGKANQTAGVVRDRAGAGVRAGGEQQFDLFTGPTVPSLHQRRAKRSLFAQVKHAAAGKFTFSGGPVGTMAEIAGIAKPIMDEAQESNLLVMLDEKNMPVAVLKHSVGGKASGPIDPGVVLGVAHSIKAAKTIWSVHNHPSGMAVLSGADRNVATLLADATRGTGIEFAGMVAVTPGGRFTGTHYRDGATVGGDFFGDAIADKDAKVRGLTRKIKKLSDQPAVTNDNDISLWMMDNAPGQSGVLLLDNRNRPAAFVPMATATMAKLRTGEKGTGASELLAAAEQVNATALVPISTDRGKAGEAAARNVAVFAHAHAFTVLDALVDGQSARDLVRETVDDHKWRGGAKSAASAFFSKGEAAPDATPADIPAELSAKYGRLRARRLLGRSVTVLESQEEAKALVARLGGKLSAAFHGSPHDFDAFRMSAIGTGEGAQAYGYGLYFAGNKEVAEWYKEKLSKTTRKHNAFDGRKITAKYAEELSRSNDPNVRRVFGDFAYHSLQTSKNLVDLFTQKMNTWLSREISEREKAKKYVKGRDSIVASTYTDKDYLERAQYYKEMADSFRSILDSGRLEHVPEKKNGRLYEVELAPQEDEYLLWDRPLSEQSEKVKAMMSNATPHDGGRKRNVLEDFIGWFEENGNKKPSGKDLYRELEQSLGHSDKAASEYLHSLGIRGIKYLDGSSRGKGGGNFNYVIFDEADVEITAKYSKNGAIQGIYANGRIYLVRDGIQKGEAADVLEHEIAHATRLNIRSTAAWDRILRSIEQRTGDGTATGKALAEARALVPDDTAPDLVAEETLAYLIEKDRTDIGLVRRFIALVKKALVELGFNHAIFTAADFKALAASAARSASGVTVGDQIAYSVRSMFKPVDTNSKAFSEWFGDSKVVDANGEPLLVNHYTDAEQIEVFDLSRLGSNTGSNSDAEEASKMARLGFWFSDTDIRYTKERGKGMFADNNISAYLNISNPKMYQNFDDIWEDSGSFESGAEWREYLQAEGFDGAVVIDDTELGGTSYIAFSPTQIKSALSNTGAFSPTDPRIRYSKTSLFKPVDPASPALRRWLGNSQITEPVFHGSPTEFWTFDKNRMGENTNQARTGLGFFFAQDRNEAAGYAGLGGSNRAFYVRIENPRRMNASDLPTFRNGEEAAAFAKRMQLAGHDGLILEDEGHVVVFEPTQVKSAEINTGAFDRRNPDVRYSIANNPAAAAERQRVLGERANSLLESIAKKGLTGDKEQQLFAAMAEVLDIVDTADADLKTKAWDWFRSLPKAAARKSLGALTLRQLRDVFAKNIPQMDTFYEASRAIAADANRVMTAADEIYNKWASLDKRQAKAMSEVMIRSTIAGVNPDVAKFEHRANLKRLREGIDRNLARAAEIRDKGDAATDDEKAELARAEAGARSKADRIKNEVKRRSEYEKLATMYQGLSKEAKEVYQSVRKQYTDNLEALFDALKDRVERQIKNPEQRKSAIDAIRLRYDKFIKEGPYFPLSRFGDYIAIAETDGGDRREVRTFDSMAERTRYTRQRRAEGWTVQEKTKKEYNRETQGASGTFFEGVIRILNESEGLDAAERKSIIDEVNQHFIKSMPDLSHRKHFVHRRKVEGYSRDQMRAFADNMQHAAHHIARIRHADKMTAAVESILAESRMLDKDANGDAYVDLHNELVKRLEIMNNPNISPVTQAVTSFGFLMNIGPSIASALVNISQTPLVAFPILANRFKGLGAITAMNALTKASADYFTSKPSWASGPSLVDNKKLPREERDMIRALIDDGTIDVTQAHSLAQAAGSDYLNLARTKYGHIGARAMRLVAYPFHIAELANRKITALAAYRMARKSGMGHGEAVAATREAVLDSHFDYTQANRARWMEGNVRRVLLLFKQYSQQMTWLLGRSFHQAAKGETKEVRQAAARQLGMILAGHFLVAGAMGLPVLGGMVGALSFLGNLAGDDDEPKDLEVSLRNFLADTFGAAGGDAVMNGPWRMLPGLGQLDVANRMSLGDLWFRAPNREMEGRDQFNQYVNLILGPVANNAANVFMGANSMAQGEVWRGIEMMLPKAVKDGMKAIRYSTEGVKNWKSDTLLEDLGAVELFGQALGFTPARVSEMYAGANAVKNYETRIERRRQRLMNRWVNAIRKQDTEGAREAMEEIIEFNAKNPIFRIDYQRNLVPSLRNRMRVQAQTKEGAYVPATRDEIRQVGRFANV